jgi:tetratricopeptide (TPR) repeat protein
MRKSAPVIALFAVLLAAAAAVEAQFSSPTLPPSGDNQKASVSQWIGLVEVNITYNSPDVTSPTGEDRTGKIWGQLVPYGMSNLGFGTCGDNCPWRAGANQNTVFTVSHDVEIEGRPLAAGSYGLHMLPGEEKWTIIFSNNHTSWGSFSYDETEDALRVQVEPRPSEFHEWLTYEFSDRQPSQATVALKWENLQVPWTITVNNITDLYMEAIRNDLRNDAGFTYMGYNAAAQYALGEKANLQEGLSWAEAAVGMPFIGQENFTTLTTLAQLQEANGMTAEAEATLDRAMHHPTTSVFDLHQMGRQMIAQGRPDKAMEIFQLNADTHPDAWPVNVGMARGLAALGRYDEAIPYCEKAIQNAPDELNRNNLQGLLEQLKEGKDIN